VNPFDDASPNVFIQYDDRWWRFANPVRIIVAHRPAEIPAALAAVRRAVEKDKQFAAGYLAYEAAAAYGFAVRDPDPDTPPLLWFGLYEAPVEFRWPHHEGFYSIDNWQPSIDIAAYRSALGRIKQAIADGYTYQANFTFQLQAAFSGDTLALFSDLAAAQRASYAAYLDLGRFVICSVSPELFFRLDGDRLESRPMKGTASRGLTLLDDQAQMACLKESEKNRAENVMIVDMIRNDFGRIAATGSVQVPALFVVERYPTLLQMTSTVTARTNAPLEDIFAAVYPCASITGAPKVRTMGILRDLESGPRGIYTGAIGFVAPGRRAQFNVAIRTAVIDRASGKLAYGVGSGVVWDSDADAEYEECLLKARVLAHNRNFPHDFQLLESILWTPEQGFFLLDRHLRRLGDSAAYFGFSCSIDAARDDLNQAMIGRTTAHKVRLLVDRNGHVTIEWQPLSQGGRPEPIHIGYATDPVSSGDVWLYHKTTRRDVYERARRSRPDCDEVILWNERVEVTESTSANIVVELGGRRYTPPVSSGLLAGTFRAHLLQNGEITERELTIDDLSSATGLWLINSVRGWQRAVIVDPPSDPRWISRSGIETRSD
jgi:para-aminobenzoate synthetase/4-amino-4-deoxychorismate lyase